MKSTQPEYWETVEVLKVGPSSLERFFTTAPMCEPTVKVLDSNVFYRVGTVRSFIILAPDPNPWREGAQLVIHVRTKHNKRGDEYESAEVHRVIREAPP